MPVTNPPAADGYTLALEEARRALDEQERAVTELRSRAGTLISAATIATSFLGAPFAADRSLGPAGVVAIAAFVLLSFATLALLGPRWQFVFALRPADILKTHVESIVEEPATPTRLRRDMALYMDAGLDGNQAQISKMTTVFQIGCVLLTTEIVAWVVAIAFHA